MAGEIKASAAINASMTAKTRPKVNATEAAKAGRADSANIAVGALALLGRWQRVRNGHLAFTTGCACSFGGSIDLAEFDELIVDYLQQKFARDSTVTAFIADCAGAASGQPGQPGHLGRVLQALARPGTTAGTRAGTPASLAAEQARAVLQALEGSIASIEEQHPV